MPCSLMLSPLGPTTGMAQVLSDAHLEQHPRFETGGQRMEEGAEQQQTTMMNARPFRIESRSNATKRNKHQHQWVDSLKTTDVLFGRGSGPNNREGNIQWRRYLKKHKARYNAAECRFVKQEIAEEIVSKLRARNGTRFLRAATDKDKQRLGIPYHKEAWCFVDEKSILEKAKQGLRQKKEWNDWSSAPSLPKSGPDHDFKTSALSDHGSKHSSKVASAIDSHCGYQGKANHDQIQASSSLAEPNNEEPLDWTRARPPSDLLFDCELLEQLSSGKS